MAQLLLFLACCLLAIPAHAQNFTVSVVHGDTQLGKDRSSYQPAVINTTHAIPAWGKTADNSSLTIAFNDQNRFRLLPNSEAEVTTGGESDTASAWHRVVSLKIGTASFDHNAGTAPIVHLDCQTPTAVCGAVGTEYDVDATNGIYSVTSGTISVSSDQEGNLSLSSIEAGGTVTYNPGRQNTFSRGNFTGTVRLNGVRFHASDATFTIAKELDANAETAVRIDSGTLGGYGAGSYTMDGAKLKPVESKNASVHAQYLAAAQKEGALNTERAADHAANRTFGRDDELQAAAAEATRLREELFNRETVREINHQVVQQVIEQATRGAAAAAASQAAEAAARNAGRMGH
jgi:hypothetical protein